MNEDIFRTASQIYTAFLQTKGIEFMEVDESDPDHVTWVFPDREGCLRLISSFNAGKELLDPRELLKNFQILARQIAGIKRSSKFSYEARSTYR